MTRYYSVCAFTPGSGMSGSRRRHTIAYVYRKAPPGFLFHDTERRLEVSDIRLPAKYLAELFEEAKAAVVVRVSDKTLALTFSLAGIPTPVNQLIIKHGGKIPYWVQQHQEELKPLLADLLPKYASEVWIIPDVNDPARKHVQLDLVTAYDQCTQLMRLSGDCPCPMAYTGECHRHNVLPHMPEGIDEHDMRKVFLVDQQPLRRVRYTNLQGFVYASSKATDTDDFATTFRPWDDYDFNIVDERRVELKARSVARHLRNKFQELECKSCAFRVTSAYKPDVYYACNSIRSCSGHTKEPDAWTLLYNWLHNQSGFLEMPGFTAAQRTQLMLMAGTTRKTNVFTPHRRTSTLFGGFVRKDGMWMYRLTPEGGDLRRFADYASYYDLLTAVQHLPVPDETAEIPIQKVLACAIFGNYPYLHVFGKGRYDRRSVTITDYGVETVGANARYVSGSHRLTTSTKVSEWVFFLWGYTYGTLAAEVRKLPGRAEQVPDVSIDKLLQRKS